jgi:transcriptional regulator with XRE-family HTH domain
VNRAQQLARFLRARREQVNPEDVGIIVDDRRRVPGLRREEVATRAGLSADYYMRLEQGRDHQPSDQVLAGLARALLLDNDATTHLMTLGREPARSPLAPAAQQVAPHLQDLLDSWTTTAAFVHGYRLDVLAANPLARALTHVAEPGTNMLRSFFLNVEDHKRYPDLEWVLSAAVGYFRSRVGSEIDSPDVVELVKELKRESEHFSRIWARYDVKSGLSGEGLYHHPEGTFDRLRYQRFAVDGSDRQTLCVISAAPDSHDALLLSRLVSRAGDRTP